MNKSKVVVCELTVKSKLDRSIVDGKVQVVLPGGRIVLCFEDQPSIAAIQVQLTRSILDLIDVEIEDIKRVA